MTSRDLSTIDLTKKLFLLMERKRRYQFLILLILMILTSMFEVISIGAVIPFLGVLIEPSNIFELPAAQSFIQFLEVDQPTQIILPISALFAGAVLLSGSMRLILLWASVRFSFILGTDLSVKIFTQVINQPYIEHTKQNSSDIISSISIKIAQVVNQLNSQNVNPCLATILVGNNQASETYVRNKHNACEEVGIITQDHKLSADITQEKLIELIEKLNSDENVHGILLQLPLPTHLNEFDIITRIVPEKDVDGLTPHNVGLLSIGKAMLKACTPSGIIEMLGFYNIILEGKEVIVINRSNLVGKPLYHLLLQKNATVTTCHSKTKNLKEICQGADIIITGVGDRDKFILTSDMIKTNSEVIDVATTHHNGKLKGDTDFDDIISKASYASPVPGGVGPMTVAMLLKNTVTAAALSKGIELKS